MPSDCRCLFTDGHDLRRTALQEWANAGVSLADLQFLARHENIATTQKYYISNNATIIGDRVRQVQSGYSGS
ncbi:MAG: tyrosine-type recombinase/integrase [Pirellulaceae bacterium]|nr:tyrosine-type recombinase/integrase [Pirellulaceae bacterium]